ncbi:hypothetical protein HAX54_001965 [Datura stramonium]|uniref:Uncharacterized protein n=1 Tax=Datura stramonium TaxID=4076 RepID=A0ABS8WQZ7_DATST|nr:hypothetical protein [Datura stramonium]
MDSRLFEIPKTCRTSLIRNHHRPILDLSSPEMIEAVELRVEKEMRGVKKIRRGMREGGDVCDECSAGQKVIGE